MVNKNITQKTKEFYPEYLSEILTVIVLTLGLVFILAMVFTPLIGREINFISAYQPKPEWYFLWIYELIRYFPGNWAFVGSLIMPILFAGLLFCIPFIDNGNVMRRRVASLCLAFLFLTVLILTLSPVLLP